MSEPSDPQRPSSGELPQETAAFEDTEFSFGGSVPAQSPSDRDTTDSAGDSVDSMDSAEALGLAIDPEMTGIIPTVSDSSVRPETTETVTAGNSDDAAPDEARATTDSTDGTERFAVEGSQNAPGRHGLAALPPWTWILAIGLLLAVLIGIFTASLMRSNDISDSTPLTSLTPSYSHPSAWNPADAVTATAPIPAGGYDSNYGYEYEGNNSSSDTSMPTAVGTPSPTHPGTGTPIVTDSRPSPSVTPDPGETDDDTSPTGNGATGVGARDAVNGIETID